MAVLRRVVLLLCLVTTAVGQQVEGLGLDDEEDLLEWHNLRRSSVVPPATNMLEMVWNDTLASLAQNYSETCPQNSTARNPLRHTLGPAVGESLLIVSTDELDEASYMYSQLLQTYWVESVLVTWPDSCTGNYCEEYLQVVWAESQYLGCGVTECSENASVIVCNYSPGPMEPLNLTSLPDDRPYSMGGDWCSDCPTYAPDCRNDTLCYAAKDVPSSTTMTTTIQPSLSIASSPVLQYTITVTVTQNVTTGGSCPCNDPCSSEARLPNLYSILIGVIPSIAAIALLFLLFVVVAANRKRKKRAIKMCNCQTPDQTSAPAGSRRRIQVRDSGFPPKQEAVCTSQLHYLSPGHSRSTSEPIEVDRPLLPDPPTPHFEDDNNPVRGNTFSFVMPSLSYPESRFINKSSTEASSNQGWEETGRVPMIGLELIHEEQEESQVGVAQGGVASIIAKLERGKGKIITTEC